MEQSERAVCFVVLCNLLECVCVCVYVFKHKRFSFYRLLKRTTVRNHKDVCNHS